MVDTTEADAWLGTAVLTDEGRQDPGPLYERMRAEHGRWRSGLGFLVLTRYEDCMEALRHPRLGRRESDMAETGTLSGREPMDREDTATMLFLNPPDHTRIRSLVSREFTPRRVEALRPRLTALLDPALDRLAAAGGGDVMTEIAVPFPVAVISELLGVPEEGTEHIRPLVRDITALIDPAATEEMTLAGMEAAGALGEYFVGLIEEKRAHPDDGLLSALTGVEAEGDRLSIDELLANTILLYAAGFETTSNLIGNGLRLLLDNPAEMQRLRDHPEFMDSAIWEMLRHDSPVQLNVRAVLEEVDLFGETFPRGSQFLVLQGSGNHDELAYDEPERFDITRFSGAATAPTPLSFGWGAHHCLGAHLARAEGEILFGALLDRFATIELDDATLVAAGNHTGRPRYRASFTLRGLESLPVRVG